MDIADIVKDPLVVIEHADSLAPRERLAVEYTRAAMADSNAIPEPLGQQLHEHFTDPELVELTFLIGYINMLNLFNNCLEVRYNGEYSRPEARGDLEPDVVVAEIKCCQLFVARLARGSEFRQALEIAFARSARGKVQQHRCRLA